MKQIPIKICNVYAVDFPSMVYRQLEKEGEMNFSKRSIYELYPSPIKSTYALKNLAKPGVDFVEGPSFDEYFMHEIIVPDWYYPLRAIN